MTFPGPGFPDLPKSASIWYLVIIVTLCTNVSVKVKAYFFTESLGFF